jgi:hypothetical protein
MPSRPKLAILAAALSPDPREAATRARQVGVAGIVLKLAKDRLRSIAPGK